MRDKALELFREIAKELIEMPIDELIKEYDEIAKNPIIFRVPKLENEYEINFEFINNKKFQPVGYHDISHNNINNFNTELINNDKPMEEKIDYILVTDPYEIQKDEKQILTHIETNKLAA